MTSVYVVLTDPSYEPSSVEAVVSDLDTAKMIAEAEGLTYASSRARDTASDWFESGDTTWRFTCGTYGDDGMRVERHEVVP